MSEIVSVDHAYWVLLCFLHTNLIAEICAVLYSISTPACPLPKSEEFRWLSALGPLYYKPDLEADREADRETLNFEFEEHECYDEEEADAFWYSHGCKFFLP